jgi:hypothetical protein
MYNTPPVYAGVREHAHPAVDEERMGGVAEIENAQRAKAEACCTTPSTVLPMFKGTTAVEDRSVMNPTFVMNDAALEPAFDALWKEAGDQRYPRTPQRRRLPRQHVQRAAHRKRAGPVGGRDGGISPEKERIRTFPPCAYTPTTAFAHTQATQAAFKKKGSPSPRTTFRRTS